MSPGRDRCYRHVTLTGAGGAKRTTKVHRLVALAFHGAPPDPSYTASHLNGIGFDNRAENIVWESHKDNVARQDEHGTRVRGVMSRMAKLNEENVAEIRALASAGWTQWQMAERYGVDRSTISLIISGKRWCHLD